MHPYYININVYLDIFNNKPFLAVLSNKQLMCNLDMTISLFLFIYWGFNKREENFNFLRIAFLFREFVNLIGWDLYQTLIDYNVVAFRKDYKKREYSNYVLDDNLPELMEDFISTFINKDSLDNILSFNDVRVFITEFNRFLYEEKIVNYFIEPYEDKVKMK